MIVTRNWELKYEDAAEYVCATHWLCRRCGRNWHTSEIGARKCCATDMPCPNGCGRRVGNDRRCTYCDGIVTAKLFEKAERVDWDGKTPLCEWRGDTYLYSVDELVDYLDDNDLSVDDAMLCVCRRIKHQTFNMSEFLEDSTTPEQEFDDSEINEIVNEWIAKHAPTAWEPTNKVPTVESLKRFLPDRSTSNAASDA